MLQEVVCERKVILIGTHGFHLLNGTFPAVPDTGKLHTAIFYVNAIAYILESPGGDFLFNQHAPASADIEDRTSDLIILAGFKETANLIHKMAFSRCLHT